jgi:hypothetical protein
MIPSQNEMCPPYLVHTMAVFGFFLISSMGMALSGENMSSMAFKNSVGT